MASESAGSTPSIYLERAAIDNAVALVTSSDGQRQTVMTATFFGESSHVPPLLRVAISPRCLSHELILRSGWFGLSVLASGQEELALGCGAVSGREADKFARWRIRRHLTDRGVPLLPGCLTTSECRIVEQLELKDHTLFIGRIESSYRQSRIAYRQLLLVSNLIDYLDHGPGARHARRQP
jgi:flavin reductase (DIM6/NTAB) family NADH-FMN oxidoreductase RutF